MTRNEAIDRLRGLLILLVVLGHVVGAAAHIAASGVAEGFAFAYKAIYIFHMPAFFFLSGLLFRRVRFRRLMVPYFVFGGLSILLYHAIGTWFAPSNSYYAHKVAIPPWQSVAELAYGGAVLPGTVPFAANSVLWFLPVLLATEGVYALLSAVPVFGRSAPGDAGGAVRGVWFDVALAGVSLVVASPLVPSCPWPLPYGLHRVPYFLFFFCLGRLFPRSFFASGRVSVRKGLAAFVLTAAYLACCYLVPNHGLMGASFPLHGLFAALAVLGIVGTVFWAVCVPGRWLSHCGRATLAIMLLHKFVVVALQFACPPVRRLFTASGSVAWLATALVTLAAVILCLFADRLLRRYAPWAIGQRWPEKNLI